MSEQRKVAVALSIFWGVFYLGLGYANVLFQWAMPYLSYFGMGCFLLSYGLLGLMVLNRLGQKVIKGAERRLVLLYSGVIIGAILLLLSLSKGLQGWCFGAAGPFVDYWSFGVKAKMASLVELPIDYLTRYSQVIFVVVVLVCLGAFLETGGIKQRNKYGMIIVLVSLLLCVGDGVYQERTAQKLVIDGAPDLAYIGYGLKLTHGDRRPVRCFRENQFTSSLAAYGKLRQGEVDCILVYDPLPYERQLIKDFYEELVFVPIGADQLVFFTDEEMGQDKISLSTAAYWLSHQAINDEMGKSNWGSLYYRPNYYSSYQLAYTFITDEMGMPAWKNAYNRDLLTAIKTPFRREVAKYGAKTGTIGLAMGNEINRYAEYEAIKKLALYDENLHTEVIIQRPVYMVYHKQHQSAVIQQIKQWLDTPQSVKTLQQWGLEGFL